MQTQSNPINRKWHKIITWLTIASFFAQPTAAVFAAAPELHAAANGVPIVEINTPSAGGVSHNQFDRFDVNQNGLIFNNSPGMVNTQLAGYIMGNGNLGRGPAKIILTEVMGTRPTNLNGYMEIAGKRADLIIANPNGIQGSGFGFINTARATLATGKPILGAGGTLEGFNVSGGKITIQGSGMDASATTRVDLLARAVEINAGIWAKELNVVAGVNQIDSKTLTAAPAKIPKQQGIAIDVGALGGMYAGKIKLIGTENGLGVNSKGTIEAGTDLVLSSQGQITLAGTTLAGKHLALDAKEGITNQKTLYAKEKLTLKAAGQIENNGLLGSGTTMAITADGVLKNSGTAFAEKSLELKAGAIDNTAGYIEAGQLALKTHSINNTKGKILQLGNADLALEVAGTINNTAGELAANAEELRLSAGQIQNQSGKILHGGQGKLTIGAREQLDNNEGTIRTNGNIDIAAKNLINQHGEIFSAERTDIAITEKLSNTGGSLSGASELTINAKAIENKAGNIEAATLHLTADTLDNGDKGRMVNTGTSQMQVNVKDKLENQGLIGGNGAVQLSAGQAVNQDGQIIAQKELSLNAHAINNTKNGTLLSGSKLALTAREEIENQGTIIAAADTLLTAKNISSGGIVQAGVQADGTLAGQGNLIINAVEAAKLTGKNLAAEDIKITAENSSLASSQTLAGQDLTITGSKDTNTANAAISANRNLTINTDNLQNKNGQIAANKVAIHTNTLDNTAGEILHYGKEALNIETTGTLNNSFGKIAANAETFTVKAGEIRNQKGVLTHAGSETASITVSESIHNEAGTIESGGALHLGAKTIENQKGNINAVKEAQITIAGSLNNSAGQIASGATLQLKAGAIENQLGGIEANTVNITAGTLRNGEEGRIASLSEHKMQLTVEDKLVNQGRIGGNGKIEISAKEIANQDGQITAKEDLSVKVDMLSNTNNANLLSGANLTISAAEAIENKGIIIAAADHVLTAKNITSSGTLQAGIAADGTIAQDGNLIVSAAGAAELTGTNLAAKDLKIQAENVNLASSETLAGRDLTISGTKDVTARDAVVSASRNLTINAENIENQKGKIAADQVNLHAAALDNTEGKILHYGKEDLSIEATETLDNSQGEIAANAENFTVSAGQIRNQNGTLTKGGSGTANIIAGQSIHNEAGTINSGGALHLNAQIVENQRGNINAAEEAQLIIAGSLNNSAGQIASGAKLQLKGGAIENQFGGIEANTVDITAGTLRNGEEGRIASLSERAMQITVEDKLTNQGRIGGNGKVQISADEIASQSGQITAKEDLSLNAITINNAKEAALLSGGNLTINAAKNIQNQGAITASTDTVLIAKNIASSGTLQAGIAADGTIAANGNLAVNAAETATLTGQNIAAKDLNIQAKNVDLTKSETVAGQDLTILSTSDVTTGGAAVSASRNLKIDAETIENQKGQITANQVNLHAAALDNTGGRILHYGKEELTVNIAGTLDNSQGEIAANAENFTVKASTIVNAEGKIVHAGSGTLAATAEKLDNSQGEISTNGNLSLSAQTIDNAQGAITAQKQAVIVGKTLSNGNGSIETAQGLTLDTTQLNNAVGGKIVNLSGTLAIAAKQAVNNAGTIGSNHGITLQSSQIINQGQLISQKNLNITAENLQNQNGALRAGGALTAKINGNIENSGIMQSGADLSITAQAVNSTGTLAAGIDNDGQVKETGVLTIKAETIAATGKNLAAKIDLEANQIDLTGSATYAKNDLHLTSEGIIRTNDAKVTAGEKAQIKAKGAIENNRGQIEAGALTLEANSIGNSQGKILQYKDAAAKITSTAAINNTDGQIAANGASLTIHTGSLDNTRGKITYAGANELKITTDREIDNTAGNIHSNGTLALNAENLKSLQGEISALEDMKLTLEQNLQNQQGKIISDKQLEITAKGNLENTQGLLQSKQSLTLAAKNLNNGQGGNITSGGDLGLTIGETLTNNAAIVGNHNTTLAAKNILNQQGQISAGQNLDIKTSELTNTDDLTAGGNLAVTVQGNIAHTGNLIAGGNVSLDAGSIASTGTIGAGIQNDGKLKTSGDLTIHTKGEAALNGKNLAGGNFALTANQINLNGAETYARQTAAIEAKGNIKNQNGSLTARGNLTMNAGDHIGNEAGTIAAGNLSLQAVALNNQNGKILSDGAGEDQINLANGLNNTNGEILLAGNTAEIQAKTLKNESGKIAQSGTVGLKVTLKEGLANRNGQMLTNANLTVNALEINNEQGTISAQKDMNLTGKNAIDNAAGKILTGGALHLTTEQTLTNSGGKIEAAKGLAAQADQVNNGANGQILNVGTEDLDIAVNQAILNQGTIAGNGNIILTGKTADNHAGKISAGGDAVVQLSETLNNNNGAIYAGKDIKLQETNLNIDNTGGSIEAKNNLDLKVKALQNANGKIIAGVDLSLTTPKLGEGGTVQAGNNMNLTLEGDYRQKKGSSFTANGSLNLSTTGNITNEGTISAVKDLALTAGNVTNAKTGVLTANQNLTIKADKTLQNDGRIDASTIDLTAKDLINTGAVIGGNLTVHTNTLENNGSQAILATTEDMNLLVKDTLDNKDHATIYSLGSIKIAADEAQNKTGQVINQSATIEAGKDIGIYAGDLTNKRSEFETEEVEVSREDKVEVISAVSSYGCEGESNNDNIDKKYTEVITETKVKKDSGAAIIIAGNDISIDSGQITNKISEIKAGNNLSIQSNTVNNITADLKRTVNRKSIKIIYSGNEWTSTRGGNGAGPSSGQDKNHPGSSSGGATSGWKNDTYYRENSSSDEISIESIPGYAAILQGKQSVTINAKNINNITTNPEASVAGNASTLLPGSTQVVQNKQNGINTTGAGTADASTGASIEISAQTAVQSSGKQQIATTTPLVFGDNIERAGQQQKQQQQITTERYKTSLAPEALQNQTTLQDQSLDIGQSAIAVGNQSMTGSAGTNKGEVGGRHSDIGKSASDANASQPEGEADLSGNAGFGTTPGNKKTNVQPGLDFSKLPVNGLFSIRPEPTSKYLVETDKRFTDYKTFLSSDYLLDQVGYDPAKALKRLGDGFYEQQIVRDQIESKTGQLFLEGYTNNEEQYKDLLENGAKAAEDFNLTLGIALSPEQINALKEDIVWMVEQEIQGQNVLVPVVYLAPGNAKLNPSGAIIQGNNVTLNAEEEITNTSNINGGQTKITGENILNRGGTISGSTSIDIVAKKDILNQSGAIKGGQINLNAGRDLLNQTVTSPVNFGSGEQTMLSQTAQIKAEDNLNINAGQDVINQGSQIGGADITIDAGRDLTVETVTHQGSDYFTSAKTQITSQITAEENLRLSAGNDLNLESAKASAGKDITVKAGQEIKVTTTVNTVNKTGAEIVIGNLKQTSTKTNVTTDLTAGKSITIESGSDLALKGAKVNAGDTINITSGGDLTLTSEKDERKTQTHNKIKGGWEHKKTADEETVSTDLNAKNNITLTANGKESNILIEGSNAISENGKISLASTKDVTIKETTEQHESEYTSHTRKSGFLSSKTTDKHDYSLENNVIGSNLSGDSIEIRAGQDLNIKGSNIVGTNDVDLSAGRDVNIESAAKTGIEEHESQTKKSGLFSGGGLGFTIGKRTEKDSTKEKVLANQASTIGSVEGNVTIKAGEKVDIEGSNLIAKEDIDITGKQVNIDNSTDTYDYERKYELKQSGLSVSLGGKIINTAMDTVQNAEKATHVKDDRLAALYGYETAKDIKDLGKELGGATSKNAKDHISVNISIGSSKTTLEEKAHVETVNSSDIKAGNKVNITATEGDIDLTATKITGKDIELNAKENIHIESAENKQNSESKMESNSWSLGYDIGGGISGSYNKGSNKENEKNTAHVGSQIKAENEIKINSGKDTGIIGSTVAGEKVTANIGGDLNIESQQDEKTYDQNGKNMGISHNAEDKKAGTSSGLTGGKEQSKIDSDYNSVIDQAGIYADEGGFNIEVGKNTDLKGGIIASEATPDKNKISTETLTYSDIENKAEYNASKTGQGLDTRKGSKYNESGLTPANSVTDHDKKESTTHAAIAEGTVEIRSNPGQDISNLSRDTENALNQLGEIFDKKESEERLELAEKFGQHAFELVHKIGDELGWNPGSPGKVALHAAIGGIMAKLGGNDFKTGAMSGALNEALINEIAKIGDPALQQWVSYVVGKAAAEAVGGDGQSGGSVTASGTKNNWLALAPVIISGIGEAEIIAGGMAIIVGGVVYEAGSWVYEKYLNIKFNQEYPKSKNHKEVKDSSDFRPEGEPNSSKDRVDEDGNVITRRWYDGDGKAYKDTDFTNHGNPKNHPKVPHEHTWDWSSGKPTRT